MSFRIWIDPTKVDLRPNPQGNPFVMVDGVKQHLFQEGGLLYFHTGPMTPVNRKLKPAIVKVTYCATIEDGHQIVKIVRGRYVHGQFEAVVQEATRGGHGDHPFRHVLEVTASAPTISQMRRWINVLLAGEDAPKQEYGRYPKAIMDMVAAH